MPNKTASAGSGPKWWLSIMYIFISSINGDDTAPATAMRYMFSDRTLLSATRTSNVGHTHTHIEFDQWSGISRRAIVIERDLLHSNSPPMHCARPWLHMIHACPDRIRSVGRSVGAAVYASAVWLQQSCTALINIYNTKFDV